MTDRRHYPADLTRNSSIEYLENQCQNGTNFLSETSQPYDYRLARNHDRCLSCLNTKVSIQEKELTLVIPTMPKRVGLLLVQYNFAMYCNIKIIVVTRKLL